MKYQLEIEDITINIDEGFTQQLTNVLFDGSSTISGSFSTDFTIPYSEKIAALLGLLGDISIKKEALLKYNEEVLSYGYINVVSINYTSNLQPLDISVYFVSDNSTWIDNFNDTTLKDIPFPELTHNYNYEGVINAIDNWETLPYTYPLINTGYFDETVVGEDKFFPTEFNSNPLNNIIFPVSPSHPEAASICSNSVWVDTGFQSSKQLQLHYSDLIPSVKVSYLIKELYKRFGYMVKGDLFNDKTFNETYLINGDGLNVNNQKEKYLTSFIRNPLDTLYFDGAEGKVPVIRDNGADNIYFIKRGLFNTNGDVVQSLASGFKHLVTNKLPNTTYRIRIKCTILFEKSVFDALPMFQQVKINSVGFEHITDATATFIDGVLGGATLTRSDVNITGTDYYKFDIFSEDEITLKTDSVNGRRFIRLKIPTNLLTIANIAYNEVTYTMVGSEITADCQLDSTIILPEISLYDFISSVCRKFNVLITPNSNREIYFNLIDNKVDIDLDLTNNIIDKEELSFDNTLNLGQRSLFLYDNDDDKATEFRERYNIDFGTSALNVNNPNLPLELETYTDPFAAVITDRTFRFLTRRWYRIDEFQYNLPTAEVFIDGYFVEERNYGVGVLPLCFIPIYNLEENGIDKTTNGTNHRMILVRNNTELINEDLVAKKVETEPISVQHIIDNNIFPNLFCSGTDLFWLDTRDSNDEPPFIINVPTSFIPKITNYSIPNFLIRRLNFDKRKGQTLVTTDSSDRKIYNTIPTGYFAKYNPNIILKTNDSMLVYKEADKWFPYSSINSSNDLTIEDNGLFTNYFNVIKKVYNNGTKLRVTVNLSDIDIINLNLGKIIFIENTYYVIHTIEIGDDIVTLDLLKMK